MALHYDVFGVAAKPIPNQLPAFGGAATWPPSTATFIWDDAAGGGLLVDCLITVVEAQALAEWVKRHAAAPEYVYITHPHADHLLGLRAILDAFPDCVPVALAEAIPAMETQVSPAYLQVWNGFFPGQLTTAPVVPRPVSSPTIAVGAATAHLVAVGGSDTDTSSVVHVPDLGLVVSGDVVYNQTHMWLAGSTPASRASWRQALDAVSALEPATIIAGHRRPEAGDDDAGRQLTECRRYLDTFESALADSSRPSDLIERMLSAYPDLANPYTLGVAAYDLLAAAN